MKITRFDLDGTGSPHGLVALILKAEPGLKAPIPIEDLAMRFDISEIGELQTEGFVGALVTDEAKNVGGILVRKGMDDRRRRFVIGHELGHFLIPSHKPPRSGQFLCSREDMLRWTIAEQDRAARMEVEANQFSALLLLPPPLLRPFLKKSGDPGLERVLAVHEEFEVSKEAAARAYAEHHDDQVAIVIVRARTILRIYRPKSFPALSVRPDQAVPTRSGYNTATTGIGIPGDLKEIPGGLWLDVTYGKQAPRLYEQVLLQSNDYAMILLWVEEHEEEDPDENRTSKQRLLDRLDKRR